jgi:hypothetical protein
MKHDVVLAVDPAANVLPHRFGDVGPGGLLWLEDQDRRENRRHGGTFSHSRRLICGGGRVGGDRLGCEDGGKRAVPDGCQHQLAHARDLF